MMILIGDNGNGFFKQIFLCVFGIDGNDSLLVSFDTDFMYNCMQICKWGHDLKRIGETACM